jgi:hypothetical protein
MTTTQISVLARVDEALDEIQRLRERIMVQPSSAERFARLAELADSEARWWLLLFEHSRTRVYWRAALSAHEHARQGARKWQRDAAAERTHSAGSAA